MLRRIELPKARQDNEHGINMVDLMMWLVIAALLLAAAIQGIGYYQKAAFGYQAKSDLSGLNTWVTAKTAMDSKLPTASDLQASLDEGDLKMTKSGGMANTPLLAVSGNSYCVGVRAESMTGANVYYASSKNPSEVRVEESLPLDCGKVAEVVASRSDDEIEEEFATLTWTKKSSQAGQWVSMVSSSNGMNLVGGKVNGLVYTSSDGGGAWKEHNLGTGSWWGASSSNDGRILMVSSEAGVHISDNGGDSWRKADLPSGWWTDVAASNDGTRMVAASHDTGGYIYTSSDSGVTWTQRISAGTHMWQSLASSADGSILVAGSAVVVPGSPTTGAAYISKDYGRTWSLLTSLGNNGIGDFHDFDMSADGKHIIAGEASTALYTSTDSGLTWQAASVNGVLGWRGVTISDDGKVMAAGQKNGYMYTSINSGATWVKRDDSQVGTFYGVASTSDGSKIIVGQYALLISGVFTPNGDISIGTYGKGPQ